MKMFLVVFGLILFLIKEDIWSQNNDACKQKLEDYILRMANIKTPYKGNMHTFHFSIKTSFRHKTTIKNSDINLKIIIGDKFYYYYSPQLSLFADEKETYVVIHPQKLILKKNQGVNFDQANDFKKIMQFQQSIVKQGIITKCEIVNQGTSTIQNISLELNESLKSVYHINHVNYFFDLKKNELNKVEVLYSSKSDKIKQEIIYHQLIINKKIKLNSNARSVLFDTSDKLKEEFVGYELIEK